MRKQFLRYKQVADQKFGRAEKSEVISEELQVIEERVEQFHASLQKLRNKLSDCLRTKVVSDNFDKLKKKLDEYPLVQYLLNDVKQASDAALPDSPLLFRVMVSYGQSLDSILSELIQSESEIKLKVLDRFSRYAEDEASILKNKAKLKTLTLDMDSARSRLLAARDSNPEKVPQIQEELDAARAKVENCKDNLAIEVYTMAAKEVEMAHMLTILVQIQMEFYETAHKELKQLLPKISDDIHRYNRRPVYGCPLEDHLRFYGHEVAMVLEVCCSALCEMGLNIEGLFRISGNSTKIRKLKASFDAAAVNLDDFENDANSIAGALKSYLRELPDSLMTHNLYNDWMKCLSFEGDARIKEMQSVIQMLPKSNYTNLRYVIKFLALVASQADQNKMTAGNLAICLAPNLIWSPVDDGALLATNAHGILVECLISNADVFFPGQISFVSDHVPSWTGGFQDCDRDKEKTAFVSANPGTSSPPRQVNSAMVSSGTGAVASIAAATAHVISASAVAPVIGSSSLGRRPKAPAPPPPNPPFSKTGNFTHQQHSLSMNKGSDLSTSNEVLASNQNDSADPSSGIVPIFSNFSSPDDSLDDMDAIIPDPTSNATGTATASDEVDGLSKSMYGSSNSDSSRGIGSHVMNTNSSHVSNSIGHRKTNSLDRPVRPPRQAPEQQQQQTLTTSRSEDARKFTDGVLHKTTPMAQNSALSGLQTSIELPSGDGYGHQLHQQPIRPPPLTKDALENRVSSTCKTSSSVAADLKSGTGSAVSPIPEERRKQATREKPSRPMALPASSHVTVDVRPSSPVIGQIPSSTSSPMLLPKGVAPKAEISELALLSESTFEEASSVKVEPDVANNVESVAVANSAKRNNKHSSNDKHRNVIKINSDESVTSVPENNNNNTVVVSQGFTKHNGGGSSDPSSPTSVTVTLRSSDSASASAAAEAIAKNSVKNRRSMFELLQQPAASPGGSGTGFASVVPHSPPAGAVTVLNIGQTPPPDYGGSRLSKPPIPAKPRTGTETDNDMTRL